MKKEIRKYWLAAGVSGIAAVLITLGGFSFAQTTTAPAPLSCAVLGSSSAMTGIAENLEAFGGTGTYTWSGQDLTATNATGNQFSVNYPSPGTYAVMVTDSSGATATCDVNVVTAGTAGVLTCAPATQSVTVGDTASVSASGGNGTYSWSAPNLAVTNPTGVGFSANYASTGNQLITVASNGATANCEVSVLPASVTTTPPPTPGLPDTGGGYDQ